MSDGASGVLPEPCASAKRLDARGISLCSTASFSTCESELKPCRRNSLLDRPKIAILVPGFPQIKEWAYAGFAYDLIAATYSTIAVGEPVNHWIFMFIFIALIAAAYIFYHKKLREQALVKAF